MNKQERFIAIFLGLALVGWMFVSNRQATERARHAAAEPAPSESEKTAQAAAPAGPTALVTSAPLPVPETALVEPTEPEVPVKLQNDDMTLVASSHGAVLKRALLKRFLSDPGPAGTNNPPVTLDFAQSPALELNGFPDLAPNAAYHVERDAAGQAVTFSAKAERGLLVTRRIELLRDYRVKVSDTFRNAGTDVLTFGTNSVCLGAIQRGTSKNDMLSIDSFPAGPKAKVHYWDRDKQTRHLLVGAYRGGGFGCGGSKPSATGMADHTTIPVLEPQLWVAIKSRFFVTGFSSSDTNCGFMMKMSRDMKVPYYSLQEVSACAIFPGGVLGQGESRTRTYELYVGPKKLSLLQALHNGMDAVMQFGAFTWFCKLLVPTLNFFYRIIPNYGVAIVLLTFLVRIIFWPLTHKSTESMKKMQEIQPKLKELQKQFKDNPQKMQQETWAIYRENKVNPLSSCLPMLIQIPVFIALFTVLRSAVELRYAPFLWIADLSEPENLLAGVLPVPLNILPILMAATMALQSYLTPSMGDPQQQKLMMVMMPIMMLFMFYSFPSALALYWTVSQVLAIVQMLMLRRKNAQKNDPNGGVSVDQPLTRQQRRHAMAK